jgi:Ca2+-binding EF-hand superfamily protein
MDTNADGSVSKSEFENFVTSLGGTTGEADADFTALDTSGSGSVTSSQFSDAIKAFEDSTSTQNVAGLSSTSPILALLDVFAKNATSSTAGTTASVTA